MNIPSDLSISLLDENSGYYTVWSDKFLKKLFNESPQYSYTWENAVTLIKLKFNANFIKGDSIRMIVFKNEDDYIKFVFEYVE